MNILSELLAYLADRGVGTAGTNLFVGNLPTGVDNAIMIVSAPSQSADPYVDTQYLTVDIWSRNKSATLAWNKLQDIRTLLNRKSNWDLTNYHVYFSHAQGNIDDLDKDVQERQLYKLSFQLVYWDINIIS